MALAVDLIAPRATHSGRSTPFPKPAIKQDQRAARLARGALRWLIRGICWAVMLVFGIFAICVLPALVYLAAVAIGAY